MFSYCRRRRQRHAPVLARSRWASKQDSLKMGGFGPPIFFGKMTYNSRVLSRMKRNSGLIAALFLSVTTLVSGQNLRLPRDPEKLIDRAQKFWAAMTSSQRYKAVDFVLTEKRDVFLSGSSIPITKAKVLGLDLTTSADQATVRVAIDVLSTENASGFLNWTVTDTWVWKEGNWY